MLIAMAKTKILPRILMVLFLASVCMVSGCNKLEREDRSKITITGNMNENVDLNKTYEVDEGNYSEFSTGCTGSFWGKTVQFLLEPEALLVITVICISDDVPVPEGTYSIVSVECTKGITAEFASSGLKSPVYFLEISSGTMKVKDDDGTMDIDIDFTISAATGGGKMTGNFTGMMGQGTI
jgi:hypothetical protein